MTDIEESEGDVDNSGLLLLPLAPSKFVTMVVDKDDDDDSSSSDTSMSIATKGASAFVNGSAIAVCSVFRVV